jgi:hypothetical protein
VTEISTVENMKNPKCEERKSIGEILIDPNSSKWTEDFIVFHTSGELTPKEIPTKKQYCDVGYFICTRHGDPSDSSKKVKWVFNEIPVDKPYPHLTRSVE